MNRKGKIAIFVIADVFIVTFAWVFALFLTNDNYTQVFRSTYYLLLASYGITLTVNFLFGFYEKLWRHVDFYDAIKAIIASGFNVCYFAVCSIIFRALTFKWVVIVCILYVLSFLSSRFAIRAFHAIRTRIKNHEELKKANKVLVIGAGSAGTMLVREMLEGDKVSLKPVCFLDDNPKMHGLKLNGVPVAGRVDQVVEMTKKYGAEQIIIAIPSIDRKTLSEIIKKCQETKCEIKILPAVYQLIKGQVSVSNLRKVEPMDLLGREPVKVNLDEIIGYIENKVVMVTGGGGSIGSELCRQIVTHNPKQLIIFDIYENNAYEIEQEIKRKHPEINLLTLIGSCRDLGRIEDVFKKYKPEIVFHAAAHKHVPLMETSPNEAVKNNVLGTFNVADTAGKNGVKRFILISTDKAVNPTNVMGATKRICEMIVQTLDKRYETDYVAVRFGNVLGSNGSVIPLFKKQIEEGGPITVTHKDIVRYFMTIPEAVSLVLQAGAYANGGEIFVLDMGDPVRIYDMAINMIKLSGLEPFKDIDVVVTGLRPGEKLYEERLMEEEGLQKTPNQMISIGKPIVIDEDMLFERIMKLKEEAYKETDKMKKMVSELVPTYKIDTKNA